MNLETIDSKIRNGILSGTEFIAFFVFEREFFWIIDWDEHFNLDQMINIEAVCRDHNLMKYLPKGKSIEKYREEIIIRYRNGITALNPDQFPRYRESESSKVVTTQMLRDEFFSDDVGQYSILSRELEVNLSFNAPINKELILLLSRLNKKLPKFYVNYDRKIFMHMVRDRMHESTVLNGWWGAECDFEHMIPIEHRYWVRSMAEDFWAITNFPNR